MQLLRLPWRLYSMMTLWWFMLTWILFLFNIVHAKMNMIEALRKAEQNQCGCVGCCDPLPPMCCDPSCPKCLEPIRYVRNNSTIGGIPPYLTTSSTSIPSWPFTDGAMYSFFPPPVPNQDCVGARCPCNNCVCCYTETLFCVQTTTCTTAVTLTTSVFDFIVVTSNINSITTVTSFFTFTIFDSIIISQNSIILTSISSTSTFFDVTTTLVTGTSTLFETTVSEFFPDTAITLSLTVSSINTVAPIVSPILSETIFTTLNPISITETLPVTIFTPSLSTQTSFIFASFTKTLVASETVTLMATAALGGNVMIGPI